MIRRIFDTVRRYDYLAVSCVLSVTYFSTVVAFDYIQHWDELIFWSFDSRTYRAVANSIFGIEETRATGIRPFFYPLMLNLTRSFAGNFGIWIYQFTVWNLSGVLIYRSIKRATDNAFLSVAGILVFAGNLSLILLTLHALTEITVVFFLTILIVLIIEKDKFKNNHCWPLVIFVISLLTVTKPVFVMVLLFVLVYRASAIFIYIKRRTYNIRALAYLVLALSPVLVQMSIMEVKHKEFAISRIDTVTIKNFFLVKVYGEVNRISMDQAREKVGGFEQQEMRGYLLRHYDVSIPVYFRDIKENLTSSSDFINWPEEHRYLFKYMKGVNEIYFLLHVLMILPSFAVLILFFKKGNFEAVEIVVSLAIPMFLIIFSSGITFWQGDRIVLPSLPLWILLYSYILSNISSIIEEWRIAPPVGV